MNEELIQRIIQKKEFSQLLRKDVELAFSHFEKRQTSEEDKVKLTRELLHKVFSAFTSQKLLSPKEKSADWTLRKHISTRERLGHYEEIYGRLLRDFENERRISIIDLGAGVNGLSYKFMVEALIDNEKLHSQVRDSNLVVNNKFRVKDERGKLLKVDVKQKANLNYIGVESIGQLVDLMNNYFTGNFQFPVSKTFGNQKVSDSKEKLSGKAKAVHESLFNLEKIKEIIKETKKPRIIFLFKVVDSLEMLEGDYSKKLLKEIVPLVDRVVVSFATRSLIKKARFKVKRYWFENFVKENFKVIEDFELGGERYIVIEKK